RRASSSAPWTRTASRSRSGIRAASCTRRRCRAALEIQVHGVPREEGVRPLWEDGVRVPPVEQGVQVRRREVRLRFRVLRLRARLRGAPRARHGRDVQRPGALQRHPRTL
ncbi:unnamed protein product, partial [Prorocentrum cordatum]